MTREVLVSFLGLFVVLVPFLGVPRDVKDWIFVALGTGIVLFGVSLRHSRYIRSIAIARGELRGDAFSESGRHTAAAPRQRIAPSVPEHL